MKSGPLTFSDQTSKNKGFRFIFIKIDNFSKYLWAIPLKNKNSQTITQEFSKNVTTSKRSPLKMESFKFFLKNKIIHHYSRFTDKRPSIAEQVIRTVRNLLKKPVSEKANADWLSELPSVVKKYNNTLHWSTKMTPLQASKKANKKLVLNILKDKKREIQKPRYKLRQLVRTAGIKRVFSKRDSKNWSYKLYTITEVIRNTLPSHRINYLHERYN